MSRNSVAVPVWFTISTTLDQRCQHLSRSCSVRKVRYLKNWFNWLLTLSSRKQPYWNMYNQAPMEQQWQKWVVNRQTKSERVGSQGKTFDTEHSGREFAPISPSGKSVRVQFDERHSAVEMLPRGHHCRRRQPGQNASRLDRRGRVIKKWVKWDRRNAKRAQKRRSTRQPARGTSHALSRASSKKAELSLRPIRVKKSKKKKLKDEQAA